jgi:hypothetical protein
VKTEAFVCCGLGFSEPRSNPLRTLTSGIKTRFVEEYSKRCIKTRFVEEYSKRCDRYVPYCLKACKFIYVGEGHGVRWSMTAINDLTDVVDNFERVARTIQWDAINRNPVRTPG